MPLVSLELNNVRIYERARFVPDRHLNIITGANASGKTTLLEAIYLLGTGRSFRTLKIDQLQRDDAPNLSIVGQVDTKGFGQVRLGITHTVDGKRVSINGQEQRQVSGLAQHLPLQAISPDAHYEFQNSPKHRRAILDWCLFHVEQDFHANWVRYQRVLHQRNAALKEHVIRRAQQAWDLELVEIGEKINAQRQDLVAQLLPIFQSCSQKLFGDGYSSVDLILEPGWESEGSFTKSLHKDSDRDRTRGYTHSGPQCADLKIFLNSKASKLCASHGQYKLLVIALRLAQIRYLFESKGSFCCLLLDDLAAELDLDHRARLTKMLADLPAQIFATATEATLINREFWPTHKMFHVEHGILNLLS